METTQPVLSVVGEKVALGPRCRELIPLYHRWANDLELRLWLGDPLRPVSLESVTEHFERGLKDDSRAAFTIYERETLRPIGATHLSGIDHLHRTAMFMIYIGEMGCRGKGYGTETTRLMLDYGFTALGLHSIRLETHSFNDRAIRAYERAGFKVAGRWRQAYRLGDRAHDVLCMDCLSSEFEGAVLRRMLPGC